MRDNGNDRRLSSIGALAAGIAHDFNNLLANILANAELALAEIAPRSCAIRELERIRNVAIRGSEIVRELMVYAGQEPPRTELVDLSRLVTEMVEMLRISVTKHARITTDLAADLPALMAEPAELRELLMNLILNASDALGERDGEIRISTSLEADGATGRAEADANERRGCLKLEVADTGSGVMPSIEDRIFDPFVSTKQAGRGVGLSIVRTIVRKYRGSVRLSSAPGQGTRFTVLLPCTERAEDDRGEPIASAAASPGAGRTLLIVDDEEGLRLAMAQLLRREGFRVMEAHDGSAAVELLRNHAESIDTILLDLTLPGVRSEKVVEEALRLRPDIRVFLTSAYNPGNAASRFKSPQVRGFVRKPYRIRELVRLLSGEAYASLASDTGSRHRVA